MIEPIYTQIGTAIRAYRRSRGLSQQAVADHIGILRPSMTEIENGHRRLQIHELLQLADLFECSVQSLLSGAVKEVQGTAEKIDFEWREY
jgi:transcriptional regulator with XRE-family HTH domain